MSKDAPSLPDVEAILARVPYAAFLGVRAEAHGDELTLILPFKKPLIGNPALPALHGGAVGAFMELTAFAQLSVVARLTRLPKTIDITIDYLRSGKPVETFARARMVRVGRRVANVHVEAWQNERAAPIAALHGNFLLAEKA
ncbi:MAG: hotdog fold thioesterase [Alphaproteobacteria bacterium]|nr:hotdog fold thioesterase [Alphaproteobacteria bacterium]